MSDVATRPRPEASELTAEFWESAARHVLVRPVCQDCGASFFSPQIACPRCLSLNWRYEESDGHGVVYSATVVHRAPYPGFDAPFHVAIVDLEGEGWSMLTNLVGAGDESVAIGTPVELDWLDVEAGYSLPQFKPRAGEGS
jgi:uncharacterized OB-fold protein